MDLETVKNDYPKLFSKLPDDLDAFRELMVIDENENDGDVDELDEIDSSEYNYIVYLAEPFQNALGGVDGLVSLAKKLDELEPFQDFMPVEEDLYGVQIDASEDKVAEIILGCAEEMIS